MALATTCPQCKTSFKVVPEQLKLRRGMVRCGMCQHVFSGIDFLRYVEDPPKGATSGTGKPGKRPSPASRAALQDDTPTLSATTQDGFKTAFFLPETIFRSTTQIDNAEVINHSAMLPASLHRRRRDDALKFSSPKPPADEAPTRKVSSASSADIAALANDPQLSGNTNTLAIKTETQAAADFFLLPEMQTVTPAHEEPVPDLDQALDALHDLDARVDAHAEADQPDAESPKLDADSTDLDSLSIDLDSMSIDFDAVPAYRPIGAPPSPGNDEQTLGELRLASDVPNIPAEYDEWRSVNSAPTLGPTDATSSLTDPAPAGAPSPAKGGRPSSRAQPSPLPRSAPDSEDAIDYFSSSDQSRRGFSSRLAPIGWGVCALLGLLLVLQLVLGGRSLVAGSMSGAQGWLAERFATMNLRMSAPRDQASLTIESFELQTSATPNVLIMSALLRNRADYPVQWPALELSLTDAVGTLLARKVILPEDYLISPEGNPTPEASVPIGARAERPLKMAFEARNLVPAGFSVNLFYP